jgi:hypothetical protein
MERRPCPPGRFKGIVYVVNGTVTRIRVIDPDSTWQRDDRGYAEGRTRHQQAIAALITETVIAYGVDFGAGDSDAVSDHSATIGF